MHSITSTRLLFDNNPSVGINIKAGPTSAPNWIDAHATKMMTHEVTYTVLDSLLTMLIATFKISRIMAKRKQYLCFSKA